MVISSHTAATSVTRPQPDFEDFARENLLMVRRVAASRVGHELADDVVCETFLVAWNRRRLDPDFSLDRAWLAGTAINLCRLKHRSERRWQRRIRRAELLNDSQRDDRFEEELIERFDAQSAHGPLLRAFAGLTQPERDVMALIAWADLNPAEVADALGMAQGTVRSHLHRARKRLATALDNQGAHS